MRYIFIILTCFLFSFLTFAQETEHADYYDDSLIEKQTISENDLQNYKSDKDFNYLEAEHEDNFFDKAVRWLRNALRKFWEAIFGVGTAKGFIYFMFRVFPYLVLGFLIFMLVRFFLKVNSNKLILKDREKGQINYSEEEQIIKNKNISALITEAVKQKNYRLAIRYYYLLALKNLTETDNIEWKPQKTNEDYIKELNTSNFKFDFENITKIYDYVWYGEFNIDALKFESLKLPFESLNNTIKD